MHTTEPVNILLVDDEPANLLSLQVVLAPLRANLICASSGPEALRQLLQADFAAVLLDIRMPTMDGFEVARMIRARSRSNRTPILFLTAADDADVLVEEAYALGAVDFLRKPLSPVIVRAKISIFVELYRKTEDLTRIQRDKYTAAIDARDSRIRLILDNTKDYAFIGTDRHGVISEWAGGAEAISGWRPADAIGKSIAILSTPEDLLAQQPAHERRLAVAEGRAEDKRWHRRQDGQPFYADGVVVALNDAQGQLQGFAKIFRDATVERTAADAIIAGEERLRESEERVRLATQAGGLGVWTWLPDASDRMSWENSLPYDIFGRAAAEPAPTRAEFTAGYLDADDRIAFCDAIDQALAQQSSFTFQGRFRKPGDARVRWAELTGRYHAAGAARPARLLGTVADITERKETEERLRSLAADLSAVDQRKTTFLATLAHELRNPLAPLVNALAIMAHAQHDAPAQASSREIMQRQVNHMVHLVDDLLDLARISGDKIALRKQRVTLADVIAHAVETSQPLIDAARHALTVALDEAPVMIEVDPVRMAQVVSNLLNNAAKYTPPGGRITVRVERAAGSVTIHVTDTGIGIPPEAQHAIFAMFNQVERHLERSQGGLGIGLALVHRLVSLHEGAVSVASAGEGQGSTFSVRLPLPPYAGLPIPVCTSAPATGAPSALRTLVVDDNDDAAQTFAGLLTVFGHSTATASNGLEALALAPQFAPDVIFLDIGMPLMNGYEAAAALRAMPAMANVVLIALTGWGNEQDIARSREAGFDRHLVKPVSIDALTRVLAEIVSATACA